MIVLVFAYLFLASAISTNKIILYALKPEFLVGIRMTVAALLLALYSLTYAHHRLKWKQVKDYFPWLIIIALFTTFFPANLKAYALSHMQSSKMAFFGTLDPFVTALYTFVVYKERLTFQKWLGILIGFMGMMILIFTSSPLEEQLKAFSVVSYPELAAFWAIILSRFGWITAQQLLKKDILGPVQLNIITMSIGGIISLCAAYLRNQTSITSLAQAPLPFLEQALSVVSPTAQLMGFTAYTIIVGNMLGYTFYAHALKQYSATFISLSGFSIPLLVALFGWLFLNEPLSLTFFVACAVTFIGMAIFFFDERQKSF
jgi:drug/metabolite transporter (DMT)-like permease